MSKIFSSLTVIGPIRGSVLLEVIQMTARVLRTKTILPFFVTLLTAWTSDNAIRLPIRSIASSTTTCATNSEDPYDAGIPMPSGKYKDQCGDTSKSRALRLLSQTGDPHKTRILQVANFKYNGHFYRAEIPLDGISHASYLFVDLNFSGTSALRSFLSITAAHNELRIRTNPKNPVRLYSQLLDQNSKSGVKVKPSSPVAQVDDFIISYNFLAPKDVQYNPLDGLSEDNYLSILQMFATKDEVKKRFFPTDPQRPRDVYELPLSLSGEDTAKIVVAAAVISDQIQYGEHYNTLTRNCVTRLFDVIASGKGDVIASGGTDALSAHADSESPGATIQFQYHKLSPRVASVTSAVSGLSKWNLVSGETRLNLMNTEFEVSKVNDGSNPSKYFLESNWLNYFWRHKMSVNQINQWTEYFWTH
jgi:hypothetical protein